jgi:hypothetical protein
MPDDTTLLYLPVALAYGGLALAVVIILWQARLQLRDARSAWADETQVYRPPVRRFRVPRISGWGRLTALGASLVHRGEVLARRLPIGQARLTDGTGLQAKRQTP